VTWDESHVIFGGLTTCFPLTKFWEFLGHVDLFWDFDSLLKEERKLKWRSRVLDPFLGFWEYITGRGCHPMGLPMFRPILYVYIDV
jgi:hypothetical protein